MGALKKIASSGGRRENVWGISCEKSRFYDKKSYFFQLRREARKCLGYLYIFIYIFSNFRGGRAPGAPPLDPPLECIWVAHVPFWGLHVFGIVKLRGCAAPIKVLLLTEFRVDEIRDIALYSELIKRIYIYG